jgi:hypothetical protein
MKRNRSGEVLPHIIVVRLDESEYWDEELVAKAGKVYAYYLFDKNFVTYLCEMRASYAMHFIHNQSEIRLEDDEDFDTLLMAEDQPDVEYIHEITYPSDYEEIRDDYCSGFTTEELKYYAQEENYDEFLEDAVAFYRSCWP